MFFRLFFFSTIFCNLLSQLHTSYLYGEIDGHFENEMSISILFYFRNISAGILFYAIDRKQNKFLITIGEKFHINRKVICNFNGLIFYKRVDRFYWANEFKLYLEFQNNNIYAPYFNRQLLSNVFHNNSIYPDPFLGYPIPKNYHRTFDKINFWIGNIGPYIGYNNIIYPSFRYQLIGCMDVFKVNDRKIKFLKRGYHLSERCWKKFKDEVCKEEFCEYKTKISHILDCSFSGMNVKKYCYKNLFMENDQLYAYRKIDFDIKENKFKLAWKHRNSKKYCLMEIIYRNGTTILFQLNQFNDITMCIIWHPMMECTVKILDKVLPNMINVLYIDFKLSDFHIKISHGEDVKTYIESVYVDLYVVNVGFSSNFRFCEKFDGEIAFLYNTSQFQQFIPHERYRFYKIYLWQIVIILVILLLILLIVCVIIPCIIRRTIKNTTRSRNMSNIYDESSTYEYCRSEIRLNVERISYTYDFTN